MSEHAWVLENVPSYIAGGLEAAECERLEQHTAACAGCSQALREAQAVDQALVALFAGVQPEPALEDRLIHRLRTVSVAGSWSLPWPARLALGTAAVLLLGVLGALLSNRIEQGALRFPGTAARLPPGTSLASNHLRSLGLALDSISPPSYRNDNGAINGEPLALGDANELALFMREKTLDSLGIPSGEVRLGVPMLSYKGSNADRPALSSAGGGGRPGEGDVIMDASSVSSTTPALPAPPVSGPSSRPLSEEKKPVGSFGSQLHFFNTKQPSPPAGTTSPDGKSLATAGRDSSVRFWDGTRGKEVATAPPAVDYFKPGQVTARPQQENKLVEGRDAEKETKEVWAERGRELARPQSQTELRKSADDKKPEGTAPEPAAVRKIIIRSGELEFEIESFDTAEGSIVKLVGAVPGAFVATVNSEKLPNGKVRGSVTLRVPPDRLDALVGDLRRELGKTGELKSQRLGSQDITKQYTDLESRLRAARTMEERLLQIIKSGKGEIKDLLQAEKELGVWRTKIEEQEGELRYYSNLVALSTLTLTLYEKEIRAPAAVTETERVQMGLEVEDVDKAQQAALAAVAEAQGRVTKSELKQHAAGQFSAALQFEVAPEAAGPLRDRLRQLGTVARLEIDRVQQTESGSGRPLDVKAKRVATQFILSLYNVANIAPRETVHLLLASVDAEAVYRTILGRVQKLAGRVVSSNLNRQRNEQTTGTISFEVPSVEAEALLRELKEAGEVLRLQFTENPDAQNVTRSKRGFQVQVAGLGQVAPRETAVLQVATSDVPASYRLLQAAVVKAQARVLNAQLNEQDRQNITAQLDFEIRRTEEALMDGVLAQVGDVYSRNVVRAPEGENVVDSKLRLQVALVNQAQLPPRETVVLALEVANVDTTAAWLTAIVRESQGRTVESQVAHERTGRVTAKLAFDVPLGRAAELVDKIKGTGTVRVQQASRHPQAPDSKLAVARLDVTLSNADLIVPSDEGLWPQIRRGLATSFMALSWSLIVVIVGLCFVFPWAVVLYGIYRLVLRLRRKPGEASPAA